MRYKVGELQRGQADTATFRLAQGLGVFSIVLGIVELIWGGPLGRSLGLDGQEWIVRLYGAREILTGILILAAKDPTPWIWLRVFGDALDIGTLIYGYTRDSNDVVGIVIALVAVLGVTAADVYCAATLSGESKAPLAPPKDYTDRSGMPRSA